MPQFRNTAHLSVILTGINCNYSRKSRANSYRICLSNYIKIAIFLASVFVMTCLFSLMLGCHLESNHTLNIAYFKLQKTNFSIALSTFVVLSRILLLFFLLELIYKLKCKTKKRIAESVFVAKILEIFQNLNYNLASIGILMIVISNTSILNPGPAKINGLSCYFHNVQGLITFSFLGKPSPDLNQTNICELQAHVFGA